MAIGTRDKMYPRRDLFHLRADLPLAAKFEDHTNTHPDVVLVAGGVVLCVKVVELAYPPPICDPETAGVSRRRTTMSRRSPATALKPGVPG